MKILVLSDIEASGEWLATQTLLSQIKNKTITFYLLSYGKNTQLLDRKLFEKATLINKPSLSPPFKYYKELLLEFFNGVRVLKKIRLDFKPDYIVSTDYVLFLPSLIVFPFYKSTFFFQGFRHYYKLGIKHFNLYMFIRKYLERISWFFAENIIVPSEYAKHIIQQEMGILSKNKKIFVIPNLVRKHFFIEYKTHNLRKFRKTFHIQINAKLIVYSGLIDKRKSLIEIIEGFNLLLNDEKKIKLVIAYLSTKKDDEYFKKINLIIKKKQIIDSVLFIKDLTPENLAKLYQTATVAILASKLEMDSVFFLEALVSGLPIFSTSTGTAQELLKRIDPFFILKSYSAFSIYSSLKAFSKKPESWKQDIRIKVKKLASSLLSYDRVAQFKQLFDN